MQNQYLKIISLFTITAFLSGNEIIPQETPDHNWNSHADVARKVKHKFEDLDTYTANFQIESTDGSSRKNMSGKLFFKQPGKIRFDFSAPAGDLIVSDGKILWIYIHKLRAVGKQDLTLDKKTQDNSKIFLATPGPGISRLFSKYHYRFDTTEQPRAIDGGMYFVMDLTQRVKVGGFENIKLFIDSETYLIKKAVGTDNLSRKTTIVFSNQKINPSIEGKLFQYKPEETTRVVLNPLVDE
ncbi:MAG: outer membrane lipoprotein carrier protein LolA [Spirochaetia bacterium]|nr:outer membrane lipoprotein carrier protein LolA [Spirochaetia bacterium]